ncbi:MAG: hypothetical protein IT381_21880 [Deltaproteobacteria bacterium]|nr:hypothetical protein [Deltaproteobacteria bacterium]
MRLSGFLKSGIGAVMALALLAGGCAQTVGDINRVVPGYVKKSAFSPENKWYLQETVTRVDNNVSGSIFDGYVLNNDKIRWQIDGNWLKAYRTYENIPGETFGGNKDMQIDDLYYGSPIAIYEISSHFDIRREYNTSTGEQSNVISENTDRPPFEREYMRVNFSANLVPSFSSTDSVMSSVTLTSSAVQFFPDTAEHASDPRRFRLTDDLIQIPTRWVVSPDLYYCYTIGFFYDSGNCAPGSIDAMASFVRIDQDKEYDYAPVYYPDTIPVRDKDNNRVLVDQFGNACDKTSGGVTECKEFRLDLFQRFGYFRTQRIAIDRKADYVESGRIPLANTWPIWQQYYQRKDYDESTGLYSGEFIVDSKGNRVEIPLEKRKVRTHTFWTNTEWPDYQMEIAKRLMDDWNKLFQDSIKAAYAVEAERSDGDRKAKLLALSKLQGCKGDETSCLPAVFQWQRNSCNFENVPKLLEGKTGDLQVAISSDKAMKLRDVVNEYVGAQGIVAGNLENVCSLMEFYTDKSHPERLAQKNGKPVTELSDDMVFTWQMVGDMRFPIMNWVSRDQLSGPLGYGPSFADPETGRIVHAGANVYGHSLETYAFTAQQWLDVYNDPNAAANTVLGQDMAKYFDAITKQSKARRAEVGLRPDQRAALNQRFQKVAVGDNRQAILKDQGFNSGGDAKLEAIKGTPFEKQFLINDDLLDFWSNGRYSREKTQMSTEEIDRLYAQASPSNWATSKSRNGFLQAFRTLGTSKHPITHSDKAHCIYPSIALDDVLVPQALKYKNVKDREKVWQSISKDINWAVMLHEVGHNMGLRHNYRGSSDALNYFDEFWKLNEENADNPKKLEYEYTSIMDYGANFNTDFAGLGKYDRAAIQFAYTGLIQVFDLPQRSAVAYPPLPEEVASQNCEPTDPAKFLSIGQWCGEAATSDTFPSKDNEGDGWLMDYKKLPTLLGGVKAIKDGRKWIKFSDYVENWRAKLTNGNLPKTLPDVDGLSKKPFDIKLGGDAPMYSVPYGFCSDEFVGNVFGGACNVFDIGASVEEQIQNTVDMYEFRYIFGAFKRDRFGWDPSGWLRNLQGRYFANYTTAFRYFYFADRFYPDFYKSMDFYSDFAKASLVGLNSLSQTMTRPETGLHCLFPWGPKVGNMYVHASDYGITDCAQYRVQSVNVPVGVGRPAFLNYTQDYYYEISSIGSVYEKLVALQALADTEGSFIRFDNGANYRFSNIGYYRLFQDDMLKFITGMLSKEYRTTAGVVDKNGEYVGRPIAMEGASVQNQALLNDATLDPVDPQLFDLHKQYALLFGMALMSTTSDWKMDFAKYARVSVKGSSDDFQWGNVPDLVPAEAPRKTTCDPNQQFQCTYPDVCAETADAAGNPSGQFICAVRTKIEIQNPVSGQIYRAVANADMGGTTRPAISLGWRLLADVEEFQGQVGSLTRYATGAALQMPDDYYVAIGELDNIIQSMGGSGIPPEYFEEDNIPALIAALDALSQAMKVLREGGDVSTAPGANDLAAMLSNLTGSTITPADPDYASFVAFLAQQIESDLTRINYDYVESLEWVDTLRAYYNEFHYQYGLP